MIDPQACQHFVVLDSVPIIPGQSQFSWQQLLRKMSLKIHTEVEENMIYYDKSDVSDNWLGYTGAMDQEIENREKELGVTLPPSYKDFLRITNGFRQISFFSGQLLPVQQVEWISKKDPEFLRIYQRSFDDRVFEQEKYLVYDDRQRSVDFHTPFLGKTLQISEWVDGSVVLLNPRVKFGEEWEAWLFANWYPGARRYRSFKELMEYEYNTTAMLVQERL
jgi:hypothetical protein